MCLREQIILHFIVIEIMTIAFIKFYETVSAEHNNLSFFLIGLHAKNINNKKTHLVDNLKAKTNILNSGLRTKGCSIDADW